MLSSQTSLKPVYNKSYALVIGINRYQNVSPLTYATNDADLVYETITEQLGFPKSQVTLLKDGEATKKGIMDCFLGYADIACDPDDRLFVFFAGHGHTVMGRKEQVGFLVPVDGNLINLNALVRWDELTRNSELIKAKHILFIMDACYSGYATQRGLAPGSQRFLSNMLQRVARQVITAGKADEQVADGGGPSGKNSIFTGYMIEGMNGAAQDEHGIITANGLMNYVYRKVGSDSKSRQTPHFGYLEGDGDFIIKTPDMNHLNIENFKDSILTTISIPQELEQQPKLTTINNFAGKNGYTDASHPGYGRNDWTKYLGESHNELTREYEKAFSWFSLVVEPQAVNEPLFNIIKKQQEFKDWKRESDKPFDRFKLPQEILTTSDSVVFFNKHYGSEKLWKSFLRLHKLGNIEYAECDPVFSTFKEFRLFDFVGLIGLTWQFISFAKYLLEEENYHGGIKFIVSLIGSKETILADFSAQEGKDNKHWVNIFDQTRWYGQDHLTTLICLENNLKFEYDLVLSELDENRMFEIVVDCAQQLSLAYNHQSEPRCFNFGTLDFPWRQFFSNRNNF